MSDEPQEREAFEAWIRADSTLHLDRGENGYADMTAELMWHTWRAARKQPDAIDYTPGKWFDATTVDLMQAFYESRLPAIRKAAKEHGYAIGLHGSMRRDLDLIAAPWRDDASDADTLAHAIARAACGITRAGTHDWEQKPAGRVATCLPICWTHRHGVLSDGHIDLSVATVTQAKPEQAAHPTQAAIDVLAERQRQIRAEGWTLEHDDEHSNGELSRAAASYALEAASQLSNHFGVASELAVMAVKQWPWVKGSQKPSTERRNLIKAGALILAEIERMDRAASPKPKD